MYDSTSVIIISNYGLNRLQRVAIEERNIEGSKDSNPIFFEKYAGEHQEKIRWMKACFHIMISLGL